ncbi:hypothetical protein AB0B28_02550 [Glycomyces sp. NPDC046736]|uniref:hypothetical protein n=1 Tax=Glycomyces sp. NPDC046736 TaxID=3155615 RepID=UPI0033DC2BAC
MTDHDDDEYYDDPYEDRYLPGGSPEDAAAIAARWQPPTDSSHAEKLAFMREAAETLPPHMRDAAIAQIEALPTAEEIDAMNAQASALQEATAGLADRRYDGWDQARSTRFTIGFDGEPVELEFTQVAVAARSAQALSAALVESWNAAVANRDEAAVEINREVARITGESR